LDWLDTIIAEDLLEQSDKGNNQTTQILHEVSKQLSNYRKFKIKDLEEKGILIPQSE
jgi:hypothetical protein